MSGRKPRISTDEVTLGSMNLEELYHVLAGLIRRGYGDYKVYFNSNAGVYTTIDEVETDEHTGKVVLR